MRGQVVETLPPTWETWNFPLLNLTLVTDIWGTNQQMGTLLASQVSKAFFFKLCFVQYCLLFFFLILAKALFK